ncbi:MAG: hypothetical protein ACTS9Y_01295 [Methylophilus sp.]|uniref:hypothetical protein n=1 Tax=Methylophilus sp. TaxID=29541 RepID=UPI003FA016D6
MASNAAAKKLKPDQQRERAVEIQRLESERKALMSIYYWIKDHLARSDDDVIKAVAEKKATEVKTEADAIKGKIDAI